MIAFINYIFKRSKSRFSAIIILQVVVLYSGFGQQSFKAFSQPKKINESEIPDHSITPDSSYQFFEQWLNDSVGSQLFSKNLKNGDTIRLTKTPGFYYGKVIMSPSGKQLVYEWIIDDNTEIRIVNIDGSNPRILYSDKVLFSLLQEWSPDEKYISAMVFNKDRLFQTLLIPVSKNEPVKVLRKQQFKSLNWGFMQCKTSFSDNGKLIAYDISTNNSWYNRDIYIRPIDGGNEIPVVKNAANDLLIGWVPGSKGIVFCSDRSEKWNLYYLGILNGKPRGSPQLLKQDLGAPITVLDFTKDGSLYYKMVVHDTFNLSIATLDTASKKIIDTKILSSHIGFATAVQWSRDGKYLAYAWGIGSGYEPLTLSIRLDKTAKERLILLDKLMRHGGHGFEPQWSPDGKYIISDGRLRDYNGPGMDSQGLYEIDINSGVCKPIKTSSTICGLDCYQTPLWLTDGRIIFERRSTRSLMIKDLKTTAEKELYQQLPPGLIRSWPTSSLAVSPDGKRLAFVWAQWKDEKWINALMVLPITEGEPKEIFRTSVGEQLSVPTWMPDSRNIVFALITDGAIPKFELVKIAADGGKVEKLGLAIEGIVPYSLSVHPDGKRIAFTSGKEPYYREETWVLRNLLGNNIK